VLVGRKGSYGKVTFSEIPSFAIDTTYFIDRRSTNQHLRWLFYVLECLGLDSYSEDSAIPGLAREYVHGRGIPVPPEDEQLCLAEFLDRETAKIDALMAKKERLVELLLEKRTALVTASMSGGVAAASPMKLTPFEWLEQIPGHWALERLKWSLTAVEQGWSPLCETRPASIEEWGVLKVGCVNGTSFIADENKALPSEIEPSWEFEIKDGDLLMSRANTRELLGSIALVSHVRPRLLLCDKLYRLRVRDEKVRRVFLVLALRSAASRFQMEREANGASGSLQNIAQETIRNIWIAVPPVSEQDLIVAELHSRFTEIDRLISKTREAIERLREYRTALISAAVTGKIDVRGEVERSG